MKERLVCFHMAKNDDGKGGETLERDIEADDYSNQGNE
jgi:hypothetical protein